MNQPMQPKYVYQGHDKDLLVFYDRIVIIGKKHNKSMGEKTIPMTSITAIQFVPTRMTYGFIEFNVLGDAGAESKGLMGNTDARTSENVVTMASPSDENILREIKGFVEYQITNRPQGQGTTIIQQPISPADEIKKMKGLLDQGIITQAEFEANKRYWLETKGNPNMSGAQFAPNMSSMPNMQAPSNNMTPPSPAASVNPKIAELQKLREQGLLTAEEYQQAIAKYN